MGNINEFEISMVCYNAYNKYTIEEIEDMLTDWAESKDICLGGSVKPCDEDDKFIDKEGVIEPVFRAKDVDGAYFLGVFNSGGIDRLQAEIERVKGLNIMPHQIIDIMKKGKND